MLIWGLLIAQQFLWIGWTLIAYVGFSCFGGPWLAIFELCNWKMFHFVAQFSSPILDPMQLFFPTLWPHFQAQFWTQFWGSALTPPYLFFLQSLKLDPKIGPQNWTPKWAQNYLWKSGHVFPKIWPQIGFFSAAPFKNKGCQAHQSKKSQHPTQHGILLILWNGWKDCWSISLQVIEKKHWEGKWGNVNPECSATGEAPPCVCKNPLYFDTVFWGLALDNVSAFWYPQNSTLQHLWWTF